jgi:hypothetical protein
MLLRPRLEAKNVIFQLFLATFFQFIHFLYQLNTYAGVKAAHKSLDTLALGTERID